MPRPRVGTGSYAEGAALASGASSRLSATATRAADESVTTQPLSLERAVSTLVAAKGWDFVSMSRRGPRGIDVAVLGRSGYRIIKLAAPESVSGFSAIDDFLYDEAVRELGALSDTVTETSG